MTSDRCVVCRAGAHRPADACARCKRILDRVETRRDASGGLRRVDAAARLRALARSWRDGAFHCFYTGVRLIEDHGRWRDHRYLVFEDRIPGNEASVVVTCALVSRMKADLTEDQFKLIVTELAKAFDGGTFNQGAYGPAARDLTRRSEPEASQAARLGRQRHDRRSRVNAVHVPRRRSLRWRVERGGDARPAGVGLGGPAVVRPCLRDSRERARVGHPRGDTLDDDVRVADRHRDRIADGARLLRPTSRPVSFLMCERTVLMSDRCARWCSTLAGCCSTGTRVTCAGSSSPIRRRWNGSWRTCAPHSGTRSTIAG